MPLEIADEVSGEFARRVEAAVAAIPVAVWRPVTDGGWRVQVAEFTGDAAPAWRDHQPRGWPTGMTWANTDGMNLPGARKLVIAERRRTRQGIVVPCQRVEGVLRHELGHAFDAAAGGRNGLSSHPEFVAAFARDQSRLNVPQLPAHDQQRLAYFLQPVGGAQEAFAEAFAVQLGGGTAELPPPVFRAAFPDVMRFVDQTIQGYRPASSANESPVVASTPDRPAGRRLFSRRGR